MFYGQCWKCGERWELGTASTCKCPDETTKREWVGLTDEEIDKAWRSCDYTVPWEQHRIHIARAIEAKLKEKNA